jgi:putative selenium metabolism protein SsnA
MQIIGAPLIFTNDMRNSVIKQGAIACENSVVIEVGHQSELKAKYPDHEYKEYTHGLLTPGLINLHHHLYSSFARGWNPGRSPKDFPNILKDIWWRLDEALTPEDIYYSAIIGLCDSVKCGVTGVIDHHSSQTAISGSLSEIARAYETVGLRGSICFELSDRRGQAAFDAGIRETEASLDKWPYKASKLSAMIGMHASMTLSESSLRKIAILVQQHNIGCHFHLAEDKSDQKDCFEKYGTRIAQRFRDAGILGSKSLAIHGIHLDKSEIEILKNSSTDLAICPRSNQNNGVGVARWWEYDGVSIGIGTDGIGSDVINDAKAALYIARHESGDPSLGFGETCNMLLKNNPAIFEKVTGIKCGILAPGYPADMVLWDYEPPTPVESDNIGGHYLYGLSGSQPNMVWIDGKPVYANGAFCNIDYPALMAHARELALKLWGRL